MTVTTRDSLRKALPDIREAIALRREVAEDRVVRNLRRAVCKKIHLKQAGELEKALVDEITPLIEGQIQGIADGLLLLSPEEPLTASLSPLDGFQGKLYGDDQEVVRIEAGGFEKHLPSQHDQSTHGSGGGSFDIDNAIDSLSNFENRDSLFNKINEGNPSPSRSDTTQIKKYTAHDYKKTPVYERINMGLRDGAELRVSDKKIVTSLDKVIDDNPVRVDGVVYRAMVQHRGEPTLPELKVGEVFADKGFVSTSTDWTTGSDFQSYGSLDHKMMQIRVPKGSKALAINGLLKEGPSEHEVILPRGSKFKVVEKKTITLPHRGDREVFVMELMGADNTKSFKSSNLITKRTNNEEQWYARRNEVKFAKQLGGEATEVSAPVDIIWTDGKQIHGIELKTVIGNVHAKVKMDPRGNERKAEWIEVNDGIIHTVVLDDTEVVPGNNQEGRTASIARLMNGDKTGFDLSKRAIYYKRGYGSFRQSAMTEVGSIKELKGLMIAVDEKTFSKSHTDTAHSLVSQVVDHQRNRRDMVDRLLPLMALNMAQTAMSEMKGIGLKPKKSVKHLPGQHDQSSHAHGGSRSRVAKRTHKPATKEKQRRGEAEQARLATAVGGRDEGDNLPFDIIRGKHAAEVKTVIDNNNDKITVHPESRRRKEAEAKAKGYVIHTIAIDVRGGRRSYFHKSGVGSYRLNSMDQVSLSRLKEILSE